MAGGERGRVLVADGDEEVRRLLRVKLGAAGFEVTEAGSVAEVRAGARRLPADVLVCEGRLADGDAAALFRELRAGPGGDRLVIVVLTGVDSDDDIRAALAAGADDLVAKPFSPSEVILRLRVGLARRALIAPARDGVPPADGDLTRPELPPADGAEGDGLADPARSSR